MVPAAYVSIILVASKLLDGVTDMCAGFIVDRTKTKWGKARPYELFIIAIWIATWLLFSTPEHMSMTAKLVWIFIMYALANSICYTFLNANNTPYMVRAFKSGQIVELTSYGSIITMFAAVIFNMTFPALMAKAATSASGWSRLVLLLAVPLAAIGSGVLGILLSMVGYTGDAATMPSSALMMIRMLFTLVPAVLYIVVAVSLKGYTLNKDLDRIREENEKNRTANAASQE